MPENSAQVSIKCRRGTASLEMPQNGDPGIFLQNIFQGFLDLLAGDRIPIPVASPLRYNHDTVPPTSIPTGF